MTITISPLSQVAEQRMLEAVKTGGVADCGGQTEEVIDLAKADTWSIEPTPSGQSCSAGSVSILSQRSS